MGKAEVSAEQIERVLQMEAALVRLNDAIATVEGALDTYEQMWDDYRTSVTWRIERSGTHAA